MCLEDHLAFNGDITMGTLTILNVVVVIYVVNKFISLENVQHNMESVLSTDTTPLLVETDSQSMQNKDTHLTLLVSQAESSRTL